MTQCNHDPMFTTDGRCSKCYPPRYARVVMVQHANGTVETHPGWLASQEQRIAEVQPLCDETMEKYNKSSGGIDHLHQCGWCGEWYTGARVDHGCPSASSDLTDDEIALMQVMCNETAHDDAKDDATGRPW